MRLLKYIEITKKLYKIEISLSMLNHLFSEFPSLHVAVGNRFESCKEFDPTDFLSVAHVQYRGTQVVTLNETVSGRFVGLYLNGTGILQLYEVMVFGTYHVLGKSSTKPIEGLHLNVPKILLHSINSGNLNCSRSSHEWKFRRC